MFALNSMEELHNTHLYNGRENYIKSSRVYSQSFICEFTMHFYPFDVQHCTMDFILRVSNILLEYATYLYIPFQEKSNKYARLSKGDVRYKGKTDLAQYYIAKYDILDNVSVSKVDEDTHAVQVLHLLS